MHRGTARADNPKVFGGKFASPPVLLVPYPVFYKGGLGRFAPAKAYEAL